MVKKKTDRIVFSIVGNIYLVYNGKEYRPIKVSEIIVGSFFGEFLFTRKYKLKMKKPSINFSFSYEANYSLFSLSLHSFLLVEKYLIAFIKKQGYLVNRFFIRGGDLGFFTVIEVFPIIVKIKVPFKRLLSRFFFLGERFLFFGRPFFVKVVLLGSAFYKGIPYVPSLRTAIFEKNINTIVYLSIIQDISQGFTLLLCSILEQSVKHQFILDSTYILFENFFYLLDSTKKLKGIKVLVKGRINGSDRSRKSLFILGSFKKKKENYCFSTAITPYGVLGVKVWFYF